MTLTQALREATKHAREHPEILIGGTFAVDAKGEAVNPKDPHATCFCALGLLYKHLPDDLTPPSHDEWDTLKALLTEEVVDKIYNRNDHTTNIGDYDAVIRRQHVGFAGIKLLEELADELDKSPHSR